MREYDEAPDDESGANLHHRYISAASVEQNIAHRVGSTAARRVVMVRVAPESKRGRRVPRECL
jgi:hypothetical protein